MSGAKPRIAPVFTRYLSVLTIIFLLCSNRLVAQSTGVVVSLNVPYGQGGDTELTLDLARPAEGSGPFPAIVYVFGGSWAGGSSLQFNAALKAAAARGFIAIAPNYRTTAEHLVGGKAKYPFPSQINDVKCAVRWLRANAGQLNVDPDRIGAVGWSAGGNLALMLGLTIPSDGLEGEGGYPSFSSAVEAVVDLAGITDTVAEYEQRLRETSYLELLLGGTPAQNPEGYARASPLSYVRKGAPPVLSIHGDHDEWVPFEQSQSLHDKMLAVGASHVLIRKEGGDHNAGFDAWNDADVWAFLDLHLKQTK